MKVGGKKMKKGNKYLVLIGALILQICLGSIYTWSMFNKPLAEFHGWETSGIVLTFSIAILFFALSTLISGRMLKKVGPRKVATIGGLLYGTGVLATGLVLSNFPSLPLIYITYGVIGGTGVGFAYVCPLSTLVKWFPEIKGTITGIGVGAFGLGSIIFKPVITSLLANEAIGPNKTFLVLGVIYLVLCTGAAQLFSEPEVKAAAAGSTDHEFTPKEMVKTKSFYMMWAMFFVGCIPGLLAIGLAVGIGQDYVGLTEAVALNAVVLIAIFNTLGRLGSGAAADKFGLRKVVTGLFTITTAAVVILLVSKGNGSAVMFYASLAGIAVGFGGLLAVVPTLVGDFYGVNNIGTNYGPVFIAYGIAALVGPILKGALVYEQMFYVSVGVAIVGLAISIVMKKPSKVVATQRKTA
jgi:OFA family oxalate/formate antiporter-like MFS transporter